MTNEELNTRLYEKMFAEQEQFRDWLLSQPPAEILNHAYEYTMREDILMSLEYNDLEDSQARALLCRPLSLMLPSFFGLQSTGPQCSHKRSRARVRAT